MFNRILIAGVLLLGAVGCDDRTTPTPTRTEKSGDVHIKTPRVEIDIDRKDR